MPGQPVGAVRTDARRKLGVQQQPPGRAELGEGRQHSPADEQVAVASGLRVALRRGQQPLRLVIGADEGRATLVPRSSFTVTARLCDGSAVDSAASSSKNVYSPFPMASGSCWKAKISPARSRICPGAAGSVNVLCLPPSSHMILPVFRLTL